MQLTSEQLLKQSEDVRQELITFQGTSQTEINNLQQLLQKKFREAQQRVDQLEGQFVLLQSMAAKAQEEEGKAKPQEKKIIELPTQPKEQPK